MLRRRTVLTAGLGLLACSDQRAPTGDTRDLVTIALDERATSIDDAPPPHADDASELLLAADLGSLRTWDASAFVVHADGRACLRRIRTAVNTTLAPIKVASLDTPIAEFTGDARSLYSDGVFHGRPRTFHGHGKQIKIVGKPAHLPEALLDLDEEIEELVTILGVTSAADSGLLVWHARSHLDTAGAFDDELWIFADGHLLLRRADGDALPTFATRRVTPADLAFLTVALTRPIAPTDTTRPVVLAPGTGHKFLLASLQREMLVQPNERFPLDLEPVLRETLWLRRAFA